MTLDWLHLGTLILTIHVLGIVAACHAIMNTRTSQGAIAWAVSLTAMPYLTLVPYLFLGRSKFSGYVDARRHELDMLRTHTPRAPWRTADATDGPAADALGQAA
ncbi:PLDc N-terminal domain-containing protein, partial [Burkholderia ubonensis]|uniref:PLDc N-terminal domain-containing protein n=2 Tax=Burkholderia TaxID=32008 RepID=UPI000A5BE174